MPSKTLNSPWSLRQFTSCEGRILGASWVHLGRISGASRAHLGCISGESRRALKSVIITNELKRIVRCTEASPGCSRSYVEPMPCVYK